MNAIIGDNGIITRAQEANVQSSIANLEEFLQLKYTENYEEMAGYQSKIEGLTNVCSSYFYIPVNEGWGALRYVVDSEGHALYLIKKSGLPEEIRESLVGGDAGAGKYSDYSTLNDVYGVTSNLKVYYCSGGVDSIKGLAKENLDNDNPQREVFKEDSEMVGSLGDYDQNDDGIINAEEVKSVKELTLKSDSGVTSLKDLYNFPNLQELVLDNLNLSSLAGVENCAQLNNISFINYKNGGKIDDYSRLKKVANLIRLYLVSASKAQFTNVFTAMQQVDYTNLEYLGVCDSTSEVKDISILDSLTLRTKHAVKYLYLYNNQISDLKPLLNYINVYRLEVYNNPTLISLSGLDNMENLNYLYARSCDLGKHELFDTRLEKDGQDTDGDALSALRTEINLYYLDLQFNHQLKWIDYITGNTELNSLFLLGCENLVFDSVRQIKDIYNSIKVAVNKSINEKYLGLFNSADRLDYKNRDLTNSSNEMKALYKNTDVICLRLDNNNKLGDNDLNDGELKLSDILSTCVNLEVLSLRNITNLDNINFVQFMPNLKELDLLGCTSVEDLSPLDNYNVKLITLRIDNINIDLTQIQNTISNLSQSGCAKTFCEARYFRSGFYTTNENLMKKLGDCSNITRLEISTNTGELDFGDVDLTSCGKLLSLYLYHSSVDFKLPSSIERVELGRAGCDSDIDFSKCESLREVIFNAEDRVSNLNNTLKKLRNCLALDTLNILRLSGTSQIDVSSLNNCSNLSEFFIKGENNVRREIDIVGLGNLSSLENIIIRDSNKVIKLNGFENLKNLRTLEVSNCSLNNIDSISTLTKLTSLNFADNKISSLKALENLKKVTTINLTNNTILDDSSYVDEAGRSVSYKNMNIIAGLHSSKGGSLGSIYLAGNNITDFSAISSLTWTDWSGFNGKY